jgi:hypothetical protein
LLEQDRFLLQGWGQKLNLIFQASGLDWRIIDLILEAVESRFKAIVVHI